MIIRCLKLKVFVMGSISGTMLYNEKKAQARPAYASRTEV